MYLHCIEHKNRTLIICSAINIVVLLYLLLLQNGGDLRHLLYCTFTYIRINRDVLIEATITSTVYHRIFRFFFAAPRGSRYLIII